MQNIPIYILGLSYSQSQSGAYALVMAEEKGNRRLPIIIGAPEAQAIAIQLEGLKPTRPLTHDLFFHVLDSYDIDLLEVRISKFEEGIFYSEIVCSNGEETIVVDARTSDAVAMALRFKCPIYASAEVMEKGSVTWDHEDDSEEGDDGSDERDEIASHEYDTLSVEELERIMNEAISMEDYEKASAIRDEIKARKDRGQEP